MVRLRKAAAAAPTIALAAAMAPSAAYAANGSFQSTLNDLTGSVSGILLALGYGGLTLVGGIAFVVLVKEIIPMFAEAGKAEFNRRIAVCIGRGTAWICKWQRSCDQLYTVSGSDEQRNPGNRVREAYERCYLGRSKSSLR